MIRSGCNWRVEVVEVEDKVVIGDVVDEIINNFIIMCFWCKVRIIEEFVLVMFEEESVWNGKV